MPRMAIAVLLCILSVGCSRTPAPADSSPGVETPDIYAMFKNPPAGVELRVVGVSWDFLKMEHPISGREAWPPVVHVRFVVENKTPNELKFHVSRYADTYVIKDRFLIPPDLVSASNHVSHHAGHYRIHTLRVPPGGFTTLLADFETEIAVEEKWRTWLLCIRPRDMNFVCSPPFVAAIYVPSFYLAPRDMSRH